jgi:hypothetical protein
VENNAKEHHQKKSWIRLAKSWFKRAKPWFHLSFNQVLTLIISLAGFIVIIITLISNGHDVSTSTYLQTYGWTMEIDKIFIEKPNLKPYFMGGDSLKNKADTNCAKVEAVAEYMLDGFDAVLNNTSYFKIDPETGKDWEKTVSDYFRRSPDLRERFENERDLFGKHLNNVYDSIFPIR